jgi:hypothetical protein
MLSKIKTLKGYQLDGLDGKFGKVKEFYFDDHHWTVRYLVAETGSWLANRQVLLSPYALVSIDPDEKTIVVDLKKKQIEDSPPLSADKPVSQQFEDAYYGYYGWPTYWGGPYSWGSNPTLVRDSQKWMPRIPSGRTGDPHLRSTHEVAGYHIHALDGGIGHIEDFVIDDETWAIRYLIADTTNLWPGKKVLLSTRWIQSVSWGDKKVFVNLAKENINGAPAYTEQSLIDRDYETRLHHHYKREGYWVDDLAFVP